MEITEAVLVARRGCMCVHVRRHAGGTCVVGAGCGGRVGGGGTAGAAEEGQGGGHPGERAWAATGNGAQGWGIVQATPGNGRRDYGE